MFPSTIYLVTGANRPCRIGFALTAEILAKHDSAFVYAGVRDPAKATALEDLKIIYPGRIAIIKHVSADIESNSALAKEIEERHGKLDTVIANAAISNATRKVSEIKISDMENHFRVNALGPLVLFQSVFKLLQKSANPRFIPISSPGGSIGAEYIQLPLGMVAYASAKASLNWITRTIHFENEWLVCFPLCPGAVDTDMHAFAVAADSAGVYEDLKASGRVPTAPQTAALMIKLIDESTREKEDREFIDVDGTKIPW